MTLKAMEDGKPDPLPDEISDPIKELVH